MLYMSLRLSVIKSTIVPKKKPFFFSQEKNRFFSWKETGF